MPGTSTLAVEISHLSRQGLWVLLDAEELFIPFAQFPWFRHATIGCISSVLRPTADHLYWDQLDIDLSVRSIRDPAAFPLRAMP